MAKRPDPAATKTRLHGALAPEDAAALYECFLLDTVELASSIQGADPVIAIHPVDAVDYATAIAPGAATLPQRGRDLGERLDHVLSSLLDDGYRQVVAVGSDSPNLPVGEIERAFELLDRPDVDAVFGPATDGGYYLIGATESPGPLVTDVEMSTETVLADTLAVADAHGLRVALLAPWYDVDVPDDLDRLVADLSAPGADPSVARTTRSFLATHARAAADLASGSSAPKVAAVIPALDEAETIAEAVRRTASQPVDAVIVVDNGSSDGTGAVADRAGAVVATEPRRGYGYACAAGVAAAIDRGADIVLFLDGDLSSPPEEIPTLLAPLLAGEADLVLGSRVLGRIDDGAMAVHQRWGNAASAWLMRRLHGLQVTDHGPFRAITIDQLTALDMREMTFGWPTEMTVKSARAGATVVEVPASWLRRKAGRSKVSGTIRGSILAARYILGVTVRYSLPRR